MIYQVYREVDLPILGGGGIMNTTDALEFIMAGASAVSVGTGVFVKPRLATEIAAGLEAYLKQNDLDNISEMVGAAVRK
jgi:dihydroorotate dehydrogenase (NAD+) catalytic subunit